MARAISNSTYAQNMKQSQGQASVMMNEQNRESIQYIATVIHESVWYSWNQL